MSQLTDLQALRRQRSRRRAMRRLAVFSLIVGSVFAAMFALDYFEKNDVGQEIDSFFSLFESGDGYPIAIGGTEVLTLENADGNLALLSKNDLITYNRSGAEVGRIKQNYFDPDAVCNRSRTLLYDCGGRKLSLYSGDHLAYELTYLRDIYTATMGGSGTVAVATRSDTHTAEVLVYNRRGEKIFGWLSAEGYVTSLALPGGGNRMSVGTLELPGGVLTGVVHLFDFASAEPVARIALPGEVILHQYYTGKDQNLYVITDKNIHEIGESGAVISTYPFDGRTLWAYSADEDVITLALGDYTEQRELEIVRLDALGLAQSGAYTVHEHLIDLASDGQYTYLLIDNQLIWLDDAMQPLRVYDTPDAKVMQVIKGRVYYTTDDQLRLLVPEVQE